MLSVHKIGPGRKWEGAGVAAADAAVAFCEVFAAFAAGFEAACAVRFVAPAAELSEDDECETRLAGAVMHKLEPEPKTMSNHVDITCETDKNKDRQPATTKLQQ